MTRKAEMLSFRWRTIFVGSLASAALASTSAVGGDLVRIGDRCAAYGPGFTTTSDGTCVQSRATGWAQGGATSAGLRSDGLGMLPGAGNARHLRIHADPYFR